MKKQPIVLMRQRDFSNKINASFEFVTQNFLPLVKTIGFIAGPSALLSGIAQGIFQSQMFSAMATGDIYARFTPYLSVEYLLVMVFSVLTYFLASASVAGYVVLYEEHAATENPSLITPGMVWSKIIENLPSTITAQILSIILILIGTFLFVFPGMYLAVCFQFFMMIIIREKISATDSLKRSYELIKGKWWSTFGLLMVSALISGLVSVVFQGPLFVITMINTLGLGGNITNLKVFTIGTTVFAMVGSTIVQGFIWIALSFQYYNLVERSEGTGLRGEIDALGS